MDNIRDPEDRARQARMDTESREVFFERNWPRLLRLLKSQANNSRFAEDVASQAMIAAFDKWDEVLTYDRPDFWLNTVALRILRRLEAQARKRGYLCEDPESCARDLRVEAFRDDWIADHIDLIAAVRSLPRRQCEVIGLHYLCDYTIAETARMLGMPVGTVKAHLNAGLAGLRRHLGVTAPRKSERRIA
jgi:RNA polymerase sigma-70 factor (ECF subfamily)